LKSQDAVQGFRQIEADLKNNVFVDIHAVLLYGCESFLTDIYEKRLTERFVTPETAFMDLMRFDGEETAANDVIAACDTLPMMSEKRVVLLENYPGDEKSLASPDAKALAEYIPQAPPYTLLVITSNAVSKRSSLYKAIAESGRVYEFDRLGRPDLRSFVKSRFKSEAFSIRDEVTDEIIASSGYLDRDSTYDLLRLFGDIKRIAAYAASAEPDQAHPGLSREIRHADVAACMETSPDMDVFALMDAVSAGRKGEAIELAMDITAKENNAFQLISLLTGQFELMLGCREMQENAATYKDMMKTLGVSSEWRLKKASGFASRYSVSRLMDLLSRLYRVDADIKTGLYDERLALTMFIAEM
jgi:DNA polymerase-3 subunit delta